MQIEGEAHEIKALGQKKSVMERINDGYPVVLFVVITLFLLFPKQFYTAVGRILSAGNALIPMLLVEIFMIMTVIRYWKRIWKWCKRFVMLGEYGESVITNGEESTRISAGDVIDMIMEDRCSVGDFIDAGFSKKRAEKLSKILNDITFDTKFYTTNSFGSKKEQLEEVKLIIPNPNEGNRNSLNQELFRRNKDYLDRKFTEEDIRTRLLPVIETFL